MKSSALTLNNGQKIPQVGLGVWKAKKESECIEAVKSALEIGYRHIDTAQIYKNEQYVGEGIKQSGVSREDIFLTTKIWNDNMFAGDLTESFEESLGKLQMDYVDLLLLHFPVTELRRPAWPEMEELVESGRVKSIGVSNYTIRHLEELLSECKIKPAVNQVELHVFLRQPELVEFCRDNNIVIEAYSPLAHGKALKDDRLQEMGERYGKTPAQIMIRWCIQHGVVVLPKSVHAERIRENIEVFDFEISDEDMKMIETWPSNLRTCWDPTHVP